jgi:Na+/H+ antiporter NhaB
VRKNPGGEDVAALIELLAVVALVITIVAGLLQIYDRVAKNNKKPTD